MIWESSEFIRCRDYWGDFSFPDNNTNSIKYLLDGQQRLKSILGVFKGVHLESVDFKAFLIDTEYMDFFFKHNSTENYTELSAKGMFKYLKKGTNRTISLHQVLSLDEFDLDELLEDKNFDSDTILNLYKIRDRFYSYNMAVFTTLGDDITLAPEIFNRINTEGTRLEKEDIFIAKMFKKESDFDFKKSLDAMIEYIDFNFSSKNKKKENIQLDSINIITNSLFGESIGKALPIANFDLISREFEKIFESLKKSILFLKSKFNITYRDSLPISSALHFTTTLFYKTSDSPTSIQKNNLIKLFIECGLSNVTSYKELLEVKKVLKKIIENPEYVYKINIPEKSTIIFKNKMTSRKTKVSNTFMSTIDCIIRMRNPLAINKNISFNMDEDYIQKHHVFPTSVFKDDSYNYLNLIYLEDTFNNSINNKLPKIYFDEIKNDIYNNDINDFNKMLESNFISSNFEQNGILESDVNKFIENRLDNILKYIRQM